MLKFIHTMLHSVCVVIVVHCLTYVLLGELLPPVQHGMAKCDGIGSQTMMAQADREPKMAICIACCKALLRTCVLCFVWSSLHTPCQGTLCKLPYGASLHVKGSSIRHQHRYSQVIAIKIDR